MKSKLFRTGAIGAAIFSMASSAFAGGFLDETKIIGPSSDFPGFLDAELVPIAWPDNCSTVVYTLDDIPATTIDASIPAFVDIPPTVLAEEIQATFDEWNEIPTSFIDFQLGDIVALGNGTRTFDFINELTWETPAGAGFLASSPSVSLVEDTDLVPGDDIDGDGDSDVFDPATADPALASRCHDADGDGDIEFVPGFYEAGTILDNDVQFNDPAFNAVGFFWETEPSSDAPFGFTGSDIQAVALHEFGHSHGLSHSLINQISDTDGTGSTMFPFIDIGDEASEAGQRDLHDDDIAWSSFGYPEGTAKSGNPAIQSGDVPFRFAYDVLRGTVNTADGENILGGNVYARNYYDQRIVGEGYSGKALLAISPDLTMFNVLDPETNALDGDFEIPVLRGVYQLFLQATDGDPAAGGNISFTAFIGEVLGQLDFGEEGLTFDRSERDIEIRPGESSPFFSLYTPRFEFVTNEEVIFRNAGPLGFVGTFAAIQDADGNPFEEVIYAERFANEDISAAIADGGFVTTLLYRIFVGDASAVPTFRSAGIYLGSVNDDGTADIDFDKPIFVKENYVAQPDELSPLFIARNIFTTFKLRWALRFKPNKDVFVVLESDNDPTGPSGFPALVGLDDDGVVAGNSFLSTNGGAFEPRPQDWAIELRMSDVR